MNEQVIPGRQIHLDFHTSEKIEGVCSEFNADIFADTLKAAHVNSITLFSCGHHGMLYYDSKKFPEMVHPHLVHRNLLSEQVRACHERGIEVNLYTTIRWNKLIADLHPEWICIDENGAYQDYKGAGFFDAGFYKNLCVNTPYRDFLKEQIGEVMASIPAEGVWYDAAFMNECCCTTCRKLMREKGLDPTIKAERQQFARDTYYDMVEDLTAYAKSFNPNYNVCYNKGHVGYLDKPAIKDYSYLSFESLPGADWGYLDFPISAKYMRNFGKECFGITSRFHTEWGDFHAFRNQAAMEFEVFSMLANGCKCTIGDQMDYWGELNQDMYRQIGEVYASVEAKEPWCLNAKPLAEVGVFTAEEFYATGVAGEIPGASEGTARMLMELGLQFEFIDSSLEFEKYKLLILPDVIPTDEMFSRKISEYIKGGGKVIATYHSGLDKEGSKFMLNELNVTYEGEAPYSPDFIFPREHLARGLAKAEHVMYDRGTLVKEEKASFVQKAIRPVFNRTYENFCSHLHSPSSRKEVYPAVIETAQTAYFIHPIFTTYQNQAPAWYRKLMGNEIARLLERPLVSHNGPISVIANVLEQEVEHRKILHILHYIPFKKSKKLEIIDDRIPLHDLTVRVYELRKIKRIYQVPEKKEIDYIRDDDYVVYKIEKVDGHHMSVIEYEEEEK